MPVNRLPPPICGGFPVVRLYLSLRLFSWFAFQFGPVWELGPTGFSFYEFRPVTPFALRLKGNVTGHLLDFLSFPVSGLFVGIVAIPLVIGFRLEGLPAIPARIGIRPVLTGRFWLSIG